MRTVSCVVIFALVHKILLSGAEAVAKKLVSLNSQNKYSPTSDFTVLGIRLLHYYINWNTDTTGGVILREHTQHNKNRE